MIDWTDIQEFPILWNALTLEYSTRGSLLRTPSVATLGEVYPSQRTMVLRSLEDTPYRLVFFTDRRSTKCLDIQRNPASSAHCYFPEQKLQLQFYGTSGLNPTHPGYDDWLTSALQNPNDYSTVKTPGSAIAHPEETDFEVSSATVQFSIFEFTIQEVHLLRLGTPHKRCKWFCDNDDAWTKQWLVP